MRAFVTTTNLVVGMFMVVMFAGRYTIRNEIGLLEYDSPIFLLMGIALLASAVIAGRKPPEYKEES